MTLSFLYHSRVTDFTEDSAMQLNAARCKMRGAQTVQDGFELWQLLCLCGEYDLPQPLWRSADPLSKLRGCCR